MPESSFIRVVPDIATWTLVVVLVAVGVVDVWLALTPGAMTVTGRIQELSASYPVVPLLVGMLVGHLFWPVKR